jgi:hypothetical protein
MSVYRTRLTFYLTIVALYAAIANEPRFSRYQEFYPFFDWSLFSYSSSTRHDNALLVRSVNGQPLARPAPVSARPDLFPNAHGDVNFMKAIRSLGGAADAGRSDDHDRLQAFVETKYLSSVESAQYDLVLIKYNPIERYRDRSKYEIARTYGSYRYETKR